MQLGDNSTEGTPKRMRSYRARLRAMGLRPVQIWVPDIRRPGLKEEMARQSLRAAAAPCEQEALAFIASTADWGDPA